MVGDVRKEKRECRVLGSFFFGGTGRERYRVVQQKVEKMLCRRVWEDEEMTALVGKAGPAGALGDRGAQECDRGKV